MKILVKNTTRGLIPLYPSDFDEKKKLKLEEEYEVEVRLPRNYKFHKKYFALLNLAFENQERIQNFDLFRKIILIETGYCESVEIDGKTHVFADSLSFNSMDETTFQDVYNKTHKFCIEVFGLPENIQMELINFM